MTLTTSIAISLNLHNKGMKVEKIKYGLTSCNLRGKGGLHDFKSITDTDLL